jgi:hypothetical protein
MTVYVGNSVLAGHGIAILDGRAHAMQNGLMRLAMLALIVTIFAGCEIRDDAYINAFQPEIRLGMTEQQVVFLAGPGPPSRTPEPHKTCKEAGGVRELLYDDVLVFFGKEHIRKSVAFCFDRDGKLVLRSFEN